MGGLAHHLVEPDREHRDACVGAEPSTTRRRSRLLEHYARAAWVGAAHDDEVNVGIREGSDAEAASGPAALAALVDDLLARLPAVLDARRVRRSGPDPLAGLVAHGSRLAGDPGDGDGRPRRRPGRERRVCRHRSSPTTCSSPVLDLLTRVAVRRHGQAAVVRALSRPQRAPASVSAF